MLETTDINEFNKILNCAYNDGVYTLKKTGSSQMLYIRGKLVCTYRENINESNYSRILLENINRFRKDGNLFLQNNSIPNISNYQIKWRQIYDSFYYGDIVKVDLNSAYYTFAVKEGIISQTNNDKFFNSMEGFSKKQIKNARLACLGSYATYKEIIEGNILLPENIIKGKYSNELYNLYLYICFNIDSVMQNISNILNESNEIIFYYWDCFFIKPTSLEKLKQLISETIFEYKIESDYIESKCLHDYGRHFYQTRNDKKMYYI